MQRRCCCATIVFATCDERCTNRASCNDRFQTNNRHHRSSCCCCKDHRRQNQLYSDRNLLCHHQHLRRVSEKRIVRIFCYFFRSVAKSPNLFCLSVVDDSTGTEKQYETTKFVLQSILVRLLYLCCLLVFFDKFQPLIKKETDKTGLQGVVHFKLCLTEAALGNNAKALKYLRQSLEFGFRNFEKIYTGCLLDFLVFLTKFTENSCMQQQTVWPKLKNSQHSRR